MSSKVAVALMCLKIATVQVPSSTSLLASQNANVYLFHKTILSDANLKTKVTYIGCVVYSPQLRWSYILYYSLLVLMY